MRAIACIFLVFLYIHKYKRMFNWINYTIGPHWAVAPDDQTHNIWRISNIKKSTLDLIKTMAYLKRVLVVKTRQSPSSRRGDTDSPSDFSVI